VHSGIATLKLYQYTSFVRLAETEALSFVRSFGEAESQSRRDNQLELVASEALRIYRDPPPHGFA